MERRAIAIEGIVQGVGFRPFVYGLASELGLSGFVRNQTDGLHIEIEGESELLDRFVSELDTRHPPLARIERISWHPQRARGDSRFRIESSDNHAAAAVFISPDTATCDACLAELFDPNDRHFHYPFLNCSHCGPRLTIIQGSPYDREQTTMSAFPMCPACRAEYEDPRDRRFHAQPTACPVCGPRLMIVSAGGERIETDDPIKFVARALKCACREEGAGKIAAIKGLGGFHLACDAGDETAVGELRRRKHRDEKPFAVMVRDLAAAEALCEVNEQERKLLESPRRPIVLLRKRSVASRVAKQRARQVAALNAGRGVVEGVAPGNPYLGVMLPYTPLHHLLMQAFAGTGAGDTGAKDTGAEDAGIGDTGTEVPVPGTFPGALVMTSGNRSDEPIAYWNDEALERLEGIADLFLMHNRRIHVRCDDSVTRVVLDQEMPVRRSRGYAPEPITLPVSIGKRGNREEDPPAKAGSPGAGGILAVGGQLKNTFALGRGRHAFVSHHMGDLDDYQAYRAFEKDIALYEDLFAVEPTVIVHDLHPDYVSTRYAKRRAAKHTRATPSSEGNGELLKSPISLIAVQHHHAHMASCMAEHGLDEPVIGVSFDGTGYGTDGAIWGGEFLVGDYRDFRRAAHLRYVGMPGGERAIREPWRMALAHLLDAECGLELLEERISPTALRTVRRMFEQGFNTPRTSSAGRLFDAVASIIGVRDRVSYEGQAAIELEWLAMDAQPTRPYPLHPMTESGESLSQPVWVVDTRGVIHEVAREAAANVSASQIARRFHLTMVEIIAQVCMRIRETTGVDAVTLSGGVFMNSLLTRETDQRLTDDGFRVYRHERVPPNDGGLSLGQLAVAAVRMRSIGQTW